MEKFQGSLKITGVLEKVLGVVQDASCILERTKGVLEQVLVVLQKCVEVLCPHANSYRDTLTQMSISDVTVLIINEYVNISTLVLV